jgi:hypothetical protein
MRPKLLIMVAAAALAAAACTQTPTGTGLDRSKDPVLPETLLLGTDAGPLAVHVPTGSVLFAGMTLPSPSPSRRGGIPRPRCRGRARRSSWPTHRAARHLGRTTSVGTTNRKRSRRTTTRCS